MKQKQVKLSNNLETLFIDSPGSTFSSVQIWFRTGSALENESNAGIAHFLEHMFFKGTPKRPASAIAHEIESFGGEINAFTSFNYTCYYINAPSDYLDKSVEILLDMVSNPQFNNDDLTVERDVVFEEYRGSIDNPAQYAFLQIQENSFTGAYAKSILGKENTIKKFSRKQLLDFRQKFYSTSNSLLVVSGDLKKQKQIEETILKFKMPPGTKAQHPAFILQPKTSVNVHKKDVRMAQVTLTIQAPAYESAESKAEDLAISCLGLGETSRLYRELVLKNTLANSASSSTMYMADGGVHFLRVIFPPDHADDVLNELTRVIESILDKGMQKDELDKIKNQYIASKIYEKESLESFSFSLGHGFAQTGDINAEHVFIEEMKKVQTADVNQALKNIFKRPIHFNMQVPEEEKISEHKKTLQKFKQQLASLQKKNAESKTKLKPVVSKYDKQTQLVKLKDGISLLHRHNTMTPTFVLHAYLRGGLTEESAKNNGSYYLLSNVISKGYNKIKYEKIKQELEEQSATLSTFSGKNAYGLTMHAQTETADSVLPHFFGALFCPDIPSKFVNHEKKMIMRALENHEKDPIKQCFKEVGKLVFNDHPYAMNILGNKQTLKKISVKQLQEIHFKNLQGKEILFTYCGDMDCDSVVAQLKPYIENVDSRKPTKIQDKTYKPLLDQQVYIPFDREQTQIFIGIPTGKLTSSENIYLKMLHTHLSGQSSELFVKVRDEMGLCYHAQPVHFQALEGGYWGIYMASGHDKVDAATNAIFDIINKLRAKGFSKKEFSRIKKMIKGQNLINIQTNEDYANTYSIPTLYGLGIDHFHKTNEKIKDLTYEEFQKSIKAILSRKWNTVTVGRQAPADTK